MAVSRHGHVTTRRRVVSVAVLLATAQLATRERQARQRKRLSTKHAFIRHHFRAYAFCSLHQHRQIARRCGVRCWRRQRKRLSVKQAFIRHDFRACAFCSLHQHPTNRPTLWRALPQAPQKKRQHPVQHCPGQPQKPAQDGTAGSAATTGLCPISTNLYCSQCTRAGADWRRPAPRKSAPCRP